MHGKGGTDHQASLARVHADAQRFGIKVQVPEPQAVEIWEEHIPAWRAWCAVSGQLRGLALSTMEAAKIIWQGLDYTAAKAGLDLAGIEVSPSVWDEVRTIEAAAVEELNRRGR